MSAEVAVSADVEWNTVSGAMVETSVVGLEAADTADSVTTAGDAENVVFELCP